MTAEQLQGGFYLGGWLVEPNLNRISQPTDDKEVECFVTPKVMSLCVLLAQHSGSPVSDQVIVESIWSSTVISDSSIYQAVAQLRKALKDTPQNNRMIERVSGHGYRLTATVKLNHATKATENKPLRWRKQPRIILISSLLCIALVISAIAIVGADYFTKSHTAQISILADESSIAIFPTQNFTQPKLQELDGFSQLLMAELVSISQRDIILLRHKEAEHAADFMLLHSISNQSEALLLSVQLVNKVTGKVLWAENFSSEKSNLLGLKRQLVVALKEQLLVNPSANEPTLVSTKHSLSSTQYESFALASYLLDKRTPDALDKAKDAFESILKQSPNNVRTLMGLCNTYLFLNLYSNWSKQQAHRACGPLIKLASELAPDSGEVKAIKALLLPTNRFEEKMDLFERAITLSPNYVKGYVWFGEFLRVKGKLNRALTLHQQALNLDPVSANVNRSLAYTLLNLRRVKEAQHYYQRALSIEPNYSLRAVEELDFLALNTERARAFLHWAKHDTTKLSKRSPYLLTQALVRLSLGQLKRHNIYFPRQSQTKSIKHLCSM